MKVAIIGSGSWGTALSIKACLAGNDTYLYCRNAKTAKTMSETRENTTYLPGVQLPTNIIITSDMVEAVSDAQLILIVTPSPYVRETLLLIEPLITKEMMLLVCSKGLERHTGLRMSELLEDIVGYKTNHLGILSGPNHAEEIGRGLPAATVVSMKSMESAKVAQAILTSDKFRVYVNDDMTGVELAGTTKNIIALAAGISDGMELGDNTKAALLTRGLHEMTKFGMAFGAKRETYAGLAGMGDLIATCMSMHSRNRSAGKKLADGETMQSIIDNSQMVVEGFYAVEAAYKLAQEKYIEMPITQALYEVLYKQKPLKEAVVDLMTRDTKDEMYMHN